MSSGDLEKSLRADVDGYVHQRLSALQEEIARLQSQFNEAFTRLLERAEADPSSDASLAVAVAEHLRDARNRGIEAAAEESTRARASSDIAIIKAAVDDLDSQRTQADILNALVNRASSFAPRVAFFVVKNERATGWRARGLAGTVGDDSVRELSLPLSSDTLLSEVVRSRQSWSGEPGSHADDNQIYGGFGDEPPQRIVAVPLVARDKAVAVLYADSAGQDADAVNLEALETLVRVAGMAVELLAAKRPPAAQPQAAPGQAAEPQQAATVPAPTPEPEPEHLEATPVSESATAAAEEPHAPTTFDEPVPEPAFAAPQPAGFEAAPVEAEPAFAEASPAEAHGGSFDAAPSARPRVDEWTGRSDTFGTQPEAAPAPEAQPAAAPLGTARRYGADAELPIEVAEEERRYHNDARRFARLLVSEIKLYNEQKVREGRAGGDLYNRLREDIDRSRQMYDKRVAPQVASRYDYFHHELVSTLAEGDPSKLGEGYPGETAR